VSDALNFEKHGLQMDGGCDLYSMKAVSDDKKLIGKVNNALNEKHMSNLRIAATLPPSYAAQFAASANLSRASPFGNLSVAHNRRKYANLIAVLNATHQDHDFSNVLRPDDFIRLKSLEQAMAEVDSKIYSAHSGSLPSGTQTPGGSALWNPKMWNTIDEEMDLENCEVYSYKPEQNPFQAEDETVYWDMHYFFVNVCPKPKKKPGQKIKKKSKALDRDKRHNRVCYLYLRALKQPIYYDWNSSDTETVKRSYSFRDSVDYSLEVNKKAKYGAWQDGPVVDDDDDYEEFYDEDSDGVEYERITGRSDAYPIFIN
jgi:hypothetical protein